MKTRYILTGAVIAMAALSSCSSFLKEENLASQSAEAYFATATGYENLVRGAYNGLVSIYNSTTWYTLTQLGTDLSTQNNGDATNQLNQYVTYYSDNATVSSYWNALYAALKDANAAIGRASSVITKETDTREGMDPALLSKRVAEVKYLRALFLFEIVKNYGQGPLILEEPMSATTTSQLDGPEKFYDQILADLQDVLDSELPMKQPASEHGRVSKAAALHLRSLVYLTRGYQSYGEGEADFRAALADAENVIKNSGHKLLDDYALVHRQSNEVNDEIIFCVNFNNAAGAYTNIWSEYYLFVYREGWQDIAFSSIYCNDWASVMPTKYTYLLFDWKKDHRAEVTFMSPYNGDPATSTDGRYYGVNYFQSTNKSGKVAEGDPVLLFPVPQDCITYSKKAGSSVSFANNHNFNAAEKSAALEEGRYIYNYPTGSLAEKSYKDAGSDDYYITGFQSGNSSSRAWLPVWKFKDCNTQFNSSGTVSYGSRDIYLARLAETYLIAAEACVKLGDNADALKYINTVRQRAANNAPEAGLSLYEGTVTLDDILNERALELFGEAPRWNDLTRTGKLAERVLEYNWDVTNIYGGSIKTDLSAATNSKYSLRPIPLSWINSLSNGKELQNNPGWE